MPPPTTALRIPGSSPERKNRQSANQLPYEARPFAEKRRVRHGGKGMACSVMRGQRNRGKGMAAEAAKEQVGQNARGRNSRREH